MNTMCGQTSCLVGVGRMMGLVCSSSFRRFNHIQRKREYIQASYQETQLTSDFLVSYLQFHKKSKVNFTTEICLLLNLAFTGQPAALGNVFVHLLVFVLGLGNTAEKTIRFELVDIDNY